MAVRGFAGAAVAPPAPTPHPAAPAPVAAPRTQIFTITVPASAQPGKMFYVNINGQTYSLTYHPSVTPGNVLTVTVAVPPAPIHHQQHGGGAHQAA